MRSMPVNAAGSTGRDTARRRPNPDIGHRAVIDCYMGVLLSVGAADVTVAEVEEDPGTVVADDWARSASSTAVTEARGVELERIAAVMRRCVGGVSPSVITS